MRFLILFSALVFLPLSGSEQTENSPLQQQAVHAQNLIDRTLARMGDAWQKMKFHFSEGTERVKVTAKDAAERAVQKGKKAAGQLPGGIGK